MSVNLGVHFRALGLEVTSFMHVPEILSRRSDITARWPWELTGTMTYGILPKDQDGEMMYRCQHET
jgi:hypothetical protein